MGVPAVEFGYFRVAGKPSAKARLFHKKSKTLEKLILNGVTGGIKNKYFGKSVPAKNFVTVIAPCLDRVAKNKSGICGNRAVTISIIAESGNSRKKY